MSIKFLESLRTIQDSFTDPQIGILDKEQIPALQDLVKAAHSKLTVIPASQARRFDAFLETDDKKVFIQLTTLGVPDDGHLFIDIVSDLGEGMNHIVVLQTPKTSDVVTAQDALSLSNFKPGQLHFLSNLIEQAHSIGAAAFLHAVGGKFASKVIDAEADRSVAL